VNTYLCMMACASWCIRISLKERGMESGCARHGEPVMCVCVCEMFGCQYDAIGMRDINDIRYKR